MDVAIIGAGGLALELVSWILQANETNSENQNNLKVIGCIANHDTPPSFLKLGVSVIGRDSYFETHKINHLIAIADPATKIKIAKRLYLKSEPTQFIDPSARLDQTSTLGKGIILSPRTIVGPSCTIADYVSILPNSAIGHETNIAPGSTLNYGVIVGGNCSIGEHVLIGSGAIILQGVTIGNRVTIGAGSVVTKNVPDGQKVVGVPARPLL